MKTKGRKVKVKGPGEPITAFLIAESEKKFIVVNETGNVEMHFPKKDYKYIVLEDK